MLFCLHPPQCYFLAFGIFVELYKSIVKIVLWILGKFEKFETWPKVNLQKTWINDEE